MVLRMTRKLLWSDEQDALLTARYAAGRDVPSIAAEIGHSVQLVAQRVKMLGLERDIDRPSDIAKASLRFAADGQRVLKSGKLG
jgi:hypothetical protein